jgi:hypothetical protein
MLDVLAHGKAKQFRAAPLVMHGALARGQFVQFRDQVGVDPRVDDDLRAGRFLLRHGAKHSSRRLCSESNVNVKFT